MRRFPIAPVIFVFALIMVGIGFYVSVPSQSKKMRDVAAVVNAKSAFYATLTIQYDKPPIYQEEYRMKDVEGVSSFDYRVEGFSGKQITVVDDNRRRWDVSEFCGVDGILDQDGIWQLLDKRPRENPDAHYTLHIQQFVDMKQGERTVTFTNPQYWASTASRQYQINLAKVNPSQLLTLNGTAVADPRYQKIVDGFRAFGPDEFRSKAASARSSIVASK